MPKQFSIVYPDHSRKNVNTATKEQMLLAGELKPLDARSFAFVGRLMVFHSFRELAELAPQLEENFTRFYPGSFVVEHGEKRTRELLESPQAMGLALPARIAELAKQGAL